MSIDYHIQAHYYNNNFNLHDKTSQDLNLLVAYAIPNSETYLLNFLHFFMFPKSLSSEF